MHILHIVHHKLVSSTQIQPYYIMNGFPEIQNALKPDLFPVNSCISPYTSGVPELNQRATFGREIIRNVDNKDNLFPDIFNPKFGSYTLFVL
jgi:hypothetical protein